jgi:predicted PurR-regulated permease PerM
MAQAPNGPPVGGQQITRWVLVAFLVAILIGAMWTVRGVILLALTSIVLVVLLTTPIRFLHKRGMNRGLATAISLLTLPAFVVVFMLIVLPLLSDQIIRLTDLIEQGITQVVQQWEALNAGPPEYFLGLHLASMQSPVVPPEDPFFNGIQTLVSSIQIDSETLQQVGSQALSAFSQIGVTVIPLVSGVASVLLNILILVFMSMYLLSDPKGHEDGVIRLLPLSYRHRGRAIIDRLDDALRGWLESTVLAMIFVGLATWIGLTILGLREALALGFIAGLLAFVPTFGTLIAAVLAAIVGVLQQPQNIGWIIILTYGISLVQSQVISPLLVAGRINLPPVMVLLGQIVFGVFFGFMGLLLAVPLAAIVMVLVQEVYIKDILGDRSGDADQEDESENKPHVLVVDDGLVTDGV